MRSIPWIGRRDRVGWNHETKCLSWLRCLDFVSCCGTLSPAIVAKVLSQIACEIFDFRIFAQLPRLAIVDVPLDAHVPTDPLKKLDHLRGFFLGEEIDLQIEVAALVSFLAHPVLAYEHEASEHNGLQRQYHRQERKWERIEWWEGREQPRINQYPTGNPDELQGDECRCPGKFSDRLRESVGMRKTFLLLGFQPSNCVDVSVMDLRGPSCGGHRWSRTWPGWHDARLIIWGARRRPSSSGWFTGVLTTLFSLICFAATLTVGVLHGVAALSLLPGVLDLAERVPSALSLIILRLGVRIILLGICHTNFL
jgi:hypothetical protein